MRLALFASDVVGLRVAEHLGAIGEELACLVVDAHDRKGLNERIVAAAGVSPDRVLNTCPETRDRLPADLARLSPDLGLLAWWPYLLDERALRAMTRGYLNFHPSLLPHGRGKAPNFWALVEGTPFGTTIHWVDVGIDSGDIAFQREIPVGWDDTGETLYRKALDATVELFVESFPRIRRGDIPRIAQPSTRCHYQRELEGASRIDLDGTYTGRELLDLLRARTFAPHPSAWFETEEGRYEVRVEIRRVEERSSRKEAA